jgi:hypothetical protein
VLMTVGFSQSFKLLSASFAWRPAAAGPRACGIHRSGQLSCHPASEMLQPGPQAQENFV